MSQADTVDLSSYANDAWRRYAIETIENRALSEIYDGLKPVGRRILYEMSRMGLTPTADPVKTARVIGNTMGNFHAHGDSSIQSALETLVNSTVPPVRGVGNWGNRDNGAAAPRYTNCKLTPYGMTLVDKDYLAVTPMSPNYDGKDWEPVVLPALLPNLFLNGGSGIAVGVTLDLPPIEARGILQITQAILEGKEVTPKLAAKATRILYQNGAKQALDSAEDKAAWVQFWTTGKASLDIKPRMHQLDTKTGVLVVAGIPPSLGAMSKVIEYLQDLEAVKDVHNLGSNQKYGKDAVEILLKPSRQLNTVAQEIVDGLVATVHPKLNVVQRMQKSVEDVADIRTRIRVDGPLAVLQSWCKSRVALEVRYLEHKEKQIQGKIAHTELLILACNNREVVLKALKSNEPDAALAKSLKITLPQAGVILDMPVRRLSVLDEHKLMVQLKAQEGELKRIRTWQKNPSAKIVSDIDTLLLTALA